MASWYVLGTHSDVFLICFVWILNAVQEDAEKFGTQLKKGSKINLGVWSDFGK